ncbi:MAG TPA: Na+/H+ antiporter NhaA [Candidatus Limnocylindria bacterium]|nr:Na+/H+ antiporter NhaA [Candidatus Limnocylindria bacterium]
MNETETHLEGQTRAPHRLSALRDFLHTEAGSAIVLLAATVIALVWANSPWRDAYHALWATPLSIDLGDTTLGMDLGHWVNDGLMALFFLLIGLEIRREFDMGELRDRRRVAVPVIAAVGGMTVPVLFFLLVSSGGEAARGWAMVMATDTAFALGVLALAGRHGPLRLRVFLLTLVIIDDIAAVGVIAIVYSADISLAWLLTALALLGVMVVMRRIGIERPAAYIGLSVVIWFATLQSGVHPTVAGVAIGILTTAYPPRRDDLARATRLARRFREQPTPALARAAASRISLTLSPNERAQHGLHPISSFVVVPLFALANAGINLDADTLGRALASPLTMGVALGLVVGKPVGIISFTWLATRPRLGGLPLSVGWPSLIAASFVAGIGFTMSLLIADLSYGADLLEEAKVGILAASIAAAVLSIGIFRGLRLLPREWMRRAERRAAPPMSDLPAPVDPSRDHVRGPADALVTLVEYGDYECPFCRRAAPVVDELLARSEGTVRFVMRHLPLTDVHPNAALAAEAVEAAGAQGKFWEMHDRLLDPRSPLQAADLVGHAEAIGLDTDAFERDLHRGRFGARVARDVASAEAAGVAGTPTFFINERRYRGAYDLASLEAAVDRARRLAAPED